MLTKEQARSERDAQKREQVFFFFLFCLRWGNDSRHGGVIIPHVWLRRQEVSHREADTVTPDCWREQVVMKLLLGAGYVLAQLWRLPAVQRPRLCGVCGCTRLGCVRAYEKDCLELEVRCQIGFCIRCYANAKC